MFALVVGVNVWFIVIAIPWRDAPGVCGELALWFFVMGIVQLVILTCRILFALSVQMKGSGLSSKTAGETGVSDNRCLSALAHLFGLGWSIYAVS